MFLGMIKSRKKINGLHDRSFSGVFTKEYAEINAQIFTMEVVLNNQYESSLSVLSALKALGCKNIILAPEVSTNSFNQQISDAFKALETTQSNQANLTNLNLKLAATYGLDESILDVNQFLPIKDQVVLLKMPDEIAFSLTKEIVTELRMRGYSPLLTFPETHRNLQQDWARFFELKSCGALFQVSLLSLLSYNGEKTQILSEWLLNNNLIDYVGSGLKPQHLKFQTDWFRKPSVHQKLIHQVIPYNYQLL